MLEACGFRTEAFGSGRAFLDVFCDLNPDCVLLDLHMLGLTGWEVQARMVASGFSIPVIFITGDGDPVVLERVVPTGAAALLRKPFNEQQLLEAIEAAIK